MKSRAGQTASRFKSGKDHLPTRMLANRASVGAETYAAFRSVVSTAKANHASVFHTVWFELSTKTQGNAGPGEERNCAHCFRCI